MKVPRDVNAANLIRLLEQYGYVAIRQTGGHVRMSKKAGGGEREHNITIPNHNPIKIGTLQMIAKDVCRFCGLDITSFYRQL